MRWYDVLKAVPKACSGAQKWRLGGPVRMVRQPPRGGADYDNPHMDYDGPISHAVFLTNVYLGGRG